MSSHGELFAKLCAAITLNRKRADEPDTLADVVEGFAEANTAELVAMIRVL